MIDKINPLATVGFGWEQFAAGWARLGSAIDNWAYVSRFLFGFYIEPHVVKKTFEDALKEIS